MKSFFFAFSKYIFIGALGISLGACEVGPDYNPPDPPLPSQWTAEGASSLTSKADIDHMWWTNFNDPVLNELIASADTRNLDLKVAEARILEARANAASFHGALLPTGDVKGTATREANQFALPDASSTSFGPLLHKPFNIFQTGFDASWELDIFGGNKRAAEAADAQMQATEASRDDIRVSLLAEVARTYIQIRQDQAELATTNDIITADKKGRAIASERFQAGEAPRLDVTQAESALEQAKTELPQIQNDLAQNEYSLDVLLGSQPGATHTLVDKPAPIPTSSTTLVLNAPASVIAQRPDIRVSERKLATATAQQGVAVAKFFPDLSLNGFFGALNTSTSKLLTGANESFIAGGSVIWPIFNYGTLSDNLDAANAQQQEAMATYQKTLLEALSDVERSLNAYTDQAQFLQASEKVATKDSQSRAIALERYRSGLTSFLDVLDAERTLYDAQNQVIRARAQYAQDLVAVYKSLGGGWKTPS